MASKLPGKGSVVHVNGSSSLSDVTREARQGLEANGDVHLIASDEIALAIAFQVSAFVSAQDNRVHFFRTPNGVQLERG